MHRNHKSATLLGLGLLLLASLLLVPAVLADHEWYIEDVTCDPQDGSITIYGYNASDGSSVDSSVYVNGDYIGYFSGPGFFVGPVSYSVSHPSIGPGASILVEGYTGTSASTVCAEQSTSFFDPGDSRINRQAYAPVAVYCTDSGVEIYEINAAGEGALAISADAASLPATPTDANVLIETAGNTQFYRLTSGEYMLRVGPDTEGKFYVLIWDGCPHSYTQVYTEQNGVLTPAEVNPL